MRRTRRKFTEEFKREAVRLSNSETKTLEELAKDLEVKLPSLKLWRSQFADETSPRKQRVASIQSAADSTILQLRKELERVKKENEILKKATAFFARDHI